jgi:hypothetical protein
MIRSAYFFYLFIALLLSSCSTAEYRQTENYCYYQSLQQFPIANETRKVIKQRSVEIPTGQSICTSILLPGNVVSTSCQQATRTETHNYEDVEIFDRNKSSRDNAIRFCASQNCIVTTGNSECKNIPKNYSKHDNCQALIDMTVAKHLYDERRRVYDRCMSK